MWKTSSKKEWSLTLIFLYYYGKIMGLCPLSLNQEDKFESSCNSIIYANVISVMYTFIFGWAMVIKYYKTVDTEDTFVTILVDGFMHILQHGTIVLSWMMFAYRQRKLLTIIEDIQRTSKVGQKLGITNDNQKIVQNLAIKALFVTIYFGFIFAIDQTIYSHFSYYKSIIWVPYRLGNIVIHYTLFLFVTALEILEQRFFRLNIAIRKFMKNKCRGRTSIEENSRSRFSISTSESIAIVGKLHHDLHYVVKDLTDFFALPLAIVLTVNFVNMVSTANILYVTTKQFESWQTVKMHWFLNLRSINNYLWFFANFTEFFFISVSSGTISVVANNTGNVLHKMFINLKPNREQTFQIKKVLLQLLQNKLHISLCGLIELNYRFMYRVFGTVITYLVMVLQFYGTKCKKN